MRPSRYIHQLIDPVGNALRGLAQLFHRPVDGVALGHVGGPGAADQPLRQRVRQHQFSPGHRDEGIAAGLLCIPRFPELQSCLFPLFMATITLGRAVGFVLELQRPLAPRPFGFARSSGPSSADADSPGGMMSIKSPPERSIHNPSYPRRTRKRSPGHRRRYLLRRPESRSREGTTGKKRHSCPALLRFPSNPSSVQSEKITPSPAIPARFWQLSCNISFQ